MIYHAKSDKIILKVGDDEKSVLEMLRNNPNLTIEELSLKISKSIRSSNRIIASLKAKQLIERIGSNKTGYWKVIHK